MCHRIRCPKCGKPTWAGCGSHIEEALRGVPVAERCRCREEQAQRRQAQRAAAGGGDSWWSRLFAK
jgi:hypothetical protein